jgi:hypothetical protein
MWLIVRNNQQITHQHAYALVSALFPAVQRGGISVSRIALTISYLQKLIVTHLMKKWPAFCGPPPFIAVLAEEAETIPLLHTVCTQVVHWSLSSDFHN